MHDFDVAGPSTGRCGFAVRNASLAEIEKIADVLGEAFDRDPFNQWVCPDPGTRRRRLGDILGRLTERSVEGGAVVDVIEDMAAEVSSDMAEGPMRFAAVALWDPPGVLVPDSHEGLREEVVDALEQIYAAQPTDSHWYLDLLAARIGGKGYGSRLLQSRLAQLDASHQPSSLWTATEQNVRLYRRHGFEVINEVRFGGPGAVWWLWRQAQ